MLKIQSRVIYAVVALAVFGSGSGVALAVSTHPAHKPASRYRVANVRNAVKSVDSGLRHELRVFRYATAAANGASALAPEMQATFNEMAGARFGANLQLAREADTPTGPFYIVPGNRAVCQIGGSGFACGSDSKLGSDPRAYSTFGSSLADPPNTIHVAGIAPDSVTSIDAVLSGGTTVNVPVGSNAYSSFVPATAVRLEFHTTDQGTLAEEVPQAPAPPENGRAAKRP